jgi:hypothetical protein
MSQTELSESTALALIQAIKSVSSSNSLPDTLPAPSSTRARAAVKRCRAAWQRAFDTYMRKNKRDGAEHWAADEGREAYRNAMPLLVDYEGIRSFLACLSHGILIGAIPIEMSGQLAYAAQVALGTLRNISKPPASKQSKAAAKTAQ